MKIEWRHENSSEPGLWESHDLWVDDKSTNSWVIRYSTGKGWSDWEVRIRPVLVSGRGERYKSLKEAKAVLLALVSLSGE